MMIVQGLCRARNCMRKRKVCLFTSSGVLFASSLLRFDVLRSFLDFFIIDRCICMIFTRSSFFQGSSWSASYCPSNIALWMLRCMVHLGVMRNRPMVCAQFHMSFLLSCPLTLSGFLISLRLASLPDFFFLPLERSVSIAYGQSPCSYFTL
ncbi:hypothetical protein P280DRAFT_319424 [Massarina eburnea CBS 473.64]|uniref:Uncharacterized protein n=1 Tax=Massarina eburnea CBS 473.64 TaxID=1395130 RepID=A0A6A6RZ15_9PLEO|nr:hypothetical protein P280DRAFT_319424 [Massarina eburnea CBS 473.64]